MRNLMIALNDYILQYWLISRTDIPDYSSFLQHLTRTEITLFKSMTIECIPHETNPKYKSLKFVAVMYGVLLQFLFLFKELMFILLLSAEVFDCLKC